jgi:hypothetical protein
MPASLKLRKEDHRKLNEILGMLSLVLRSVNVDILRAALDDYKEAVDGAAFYMTQVDRPFDWLETTDLKSEALRLVIQLKEVLDKI